MNVKMALKNLINKMPYLRELYQEGIRYKTNSCFPAGHFYSPIVLIENIKKREFEIWGRDVNDKINGIDLRTEEQIRLINDFTNYYYELPFKSEKQTHLRYYFDNGYYSYTDGIILYSIIRHFKPKRIVEAGAGFSSAIMLDTNCLFFNNKIELTFIEPYPERLYTLMSEEDKKNVTVYETDIQSVPIDIFKTLQAGDILFVDSSHVVKTGSDVNFILFNILPILQTGVLIHFHDVFYPFEYPKEWVLGGYNWNEDYFIRAFLMYNNKFEILIFSSFLHKHFRETFKEMPLCYEQIGGHLWIKKK